MSSFKAVEKWFSEFLETHGNDSIREEWSNSQEEFKKTFKRKLDKPKKKKDKNAPKKYVSSYIIFCNKMRESVKSEMPDLDNKEIMKELGRRWKKLSDKEVAKYKKSSEKDKERYELEMKSYTPPESLEEDAPKKRAKKDPNAPKGPRNAYILFCQDERPAVAEDGFAGKDILSELSNRWRQMKAEKDSRVEEYEARAQEDKERYEKENKKFNQDSGKKSVTKSTKATTDKKGKVDTKTKSKQDSKAKTETKKGKTDTKAKSKGKTKAPKKEENVDDDVQDDDDESLEDEEVIVHKKAKGGKKA